MLTQPRLMVLYVIYSPVFGGPHNTAAKMHEFARSEGAEIIVVLPLDAVDAAERLRIAGVEVIQMRLSRVRATRSIRSHAVWAWEYPKQVWALVDLIRTSGCDVVVTTSLPNFQAAVAAKICGVANVAQLLDSFSPALVKLLCMLAIRFLADAIMSTGTAVAALHRGAASFGDRLITFFPCVDLQEFSGDRGTRSRMRRQLRIETDEWVVGNVANINPMKDQITFIRAAGSLRKTNTNVKFVIAGRQYDNHQRYLDSLLKEANQMELVLGKDLFIIDPGDRVADHMSAFDVFWMTSAPRSEGLPTVIGEAKAMGIPVVATDVGSTSESVTDGVSGFVVPPGDPEAIAQATRIILSQGDLREKMSASCKVEVKHTYAASVGARAHLEAFDVALHHRLSRKDSRGNHLLRMAQRALRERASRSRQRKLST